MCRRLFVRVLSGVCVCVYVCLCPSVSTVDATVTSLNKINVCLHAREKCSPFYFFDLNAGKNLVG